MGQMDSGKKVFGDRGMSADFNVGRVGRIGMSSVLVPCWGATSADLFVTPVRGYPNLWRRPGRMGRIDPQLPLAPHIYVLARVPFACPWLFLAGIGQQVALIPPHGSVFKPDRQLAELGFGGQAERTRSQQPIRPSPRDW